jgi:DMSO/TMAO reductase YedYZ heme-binding membrane subunit
VTPKLAWYVARASGMVAAGLLAASVVWGLLVSTRFVERPGPRWSLDLHRMLAGLAVSFTGLHVAALVADNYVHFGWAEVLVPFASAWHPAAVALGVVAMYLLAAVEITSLAMRRLPRRLWRRVHMGSYAAFWLAVLHGAAAGTDAAARPYRMAAVTAVAAVCFLATYRAVVTGRARGHGGVAGPRQRADVGSA